MEWGHWQRFESASLVYTSVVIVLPLGTLVAQRMALSNTLAAISSQNTNGTDGSSAVPFKTDFGGMSRIGSAQKSAIVSRVEGGRSKDRVHPLDRELEKIDNDDYENGHVLVNREFDRREERV
jgi:pheromone alpha factor receptor